MWSKGRTGRRSGLLSGIIEKCDDLAKVIAKLHNPRCSICFKSGEADKKSGLPIKGLHWHHILSKSSFPQFRFDPMNWLVLDARHHGGANLFPKCDEDYIFAHMEPEREPENDLIIIPNRFDRWLQSQENDKWCWKEEHKDDKIIVDIDYAEIFVNLRDELKGLIDNAWIDQEIQDDPRKGQGTPRIE